MLRRVSHSKQTPPAGLNRVYVFQPDIAGVTLSPIAEFAFLKNLSRVRRAAGSRTGAPAARPFDELRVARVGMGPREH
jgi:hypothetical protein